MDYDLSPSSPSPSNPIADRSYHNYVGPLRSRGMRWWIITRSTVRLATESGWVKVIAALCFLPYLVGAILVYVQSTLPANANLGMFFSGLLDDTPGQRFALQFYNALGYQILLLLILTLLAGAGLIAADNRSNALLVYLSKPITKSDYLIGKWAGLFLILFTVAFAPALLFFLYCLFSYYGDGFLRLEPWLIVHVVTAIAMTAAFLTSLMMGISSWTKSTSLAAATMAGLYFASQVVSFFLGAVRSQGNAGKNLVESHSSVGGLISGMSQWILHVTVHISAISRRRGTLFAYDIAPPPAGFLFGTAAVLILVGIVAARFRIRAVEVIPG